FPRAAGTSNIVDLLRPQLDRPFAWIPLGRVREGGRPLTARLIRLAGMVIVADAETDADLDTLVEAILELDSPPLLAAPAGPRPVDVVLVTGGEPLVALYHALGAERLDLEGAPRPGLALGRLRAPGREPLTVVTKAGGFGEPDLFVSLVREAVA